MIDQHGSEEQSRERHIRRLCPEAIQEYKERYQAEFGIELSDAEAEEQGLRLLRLSSLLLRPLPDDTEK